MPRKGDRRPLLDRLMGRIEARGSCWQWIGRLDVGGYGVGWVHDETQKGLSRKAHRLVWETLVGPIPTGLTLDHLCRNRACVNPMHLDPVSQRTNILRGEGLAARNALKVACPKGHPYDESNTRLEYGGRRVCIECARAKGRRQAAKRRAVRDGLHA